MNKAQKNKIEKVGYENNMSSQESLKAYYKICEFISNTIASTERNEDGTYDPDNFKTIHITNFGKFVPNKFKVIQINKALLLSKKDKE